jgi:hypothetical protein
MTEPMTKAERRVAKRVRIQKYLGDDAYSWALFVDGRPCFTGLTQHMAQHERRKAIRNLAGGRDWIGDELAGVS